MTKKFILCHNLKVNHTSPPSTVIGIFFMIIFVFVIIFAGGENTWAQVFVDDKKVIKIGVILSQTNPERYNSHDDRLRAMELARDDFVYDEQQNAQNNTYYDLELVELRMPRDNYGNSAENRAGIEIKQAFENHNLTYFIGPMDSFDIPSVKAQFALLERANPELEFIAISPASTAPSLSVDDNVFRMIVADTQQTIKLAELLHSDGKKHVVMIGLDQKDAWLRGLEEGFTTHFAGNMGGSITYVTYDSKYDEQSTIDAYDMLASDVDMAVSELIDEHGKDSVAVVVIMYGSHLSQLVQKINHELDNLDDVTWYGPDGVATHAGLVGQDNMHVGRFLASVQFTAIQYSGDENPTKTKVQNALEMQGVKSIDSVYTYSSYDAVSLLASAIAEQDRSENAKTVKTLLHELADDPKVGMGTLGDYSFDEYGDLDKPLSYKTWHIILDKNSIPIWTDKKQTYQQSCR